MTQVIAKLEGPAVSQYCALRLLQVISAVCTFLTFLLLMFLGQVPLYFLQATLDESLYDLAGELVCIQCVCCLFEMESEYLE